MTTLITGGGGYIGRRVAQRLRGEDVLLWGHGATVEGDLTAGEPFINVDPRAITRIVHAAAVTRFNVDPDTATKVNVEGTRKLLRFAARCPNLQSLEVLSTVYAAGLREGVIREEPIDGQTRFANEYERSKCQSEQLVLASDLPWRIERIATVIADDDSGRVTQQNAVHNTLKLLYYGLLSLVPGRPEVPLYFVTADFVAEALVRVMDRGPQRAIYHLCHTAEESIALAQFVDTVFEVFERDPRFRARRALKPLYADAESFELMVQQVSNFSGGILGQAVGSVAPFARELFSVKQFCNDRLRSVAPDLRTPDAKELVAKVCQTLIDSRFGTATS